MLPVDELPTISLILNIGFKIIKLKVIWARTLG
jgi:hypothetical protein